MSRAPSLAGRAAVAVALMVGFYVLALGMAAALLAIPYVEVRYGHGIHVQLAVACVVGAGVILWSIVPRPDRFPPPGPRLLPDGQPRLFSAIQRVAAATGQAMPAEVYLVGDVNAFVAQRGGVMGFGSRRVMGLGLPLLNVLSVGELMAVLAHEFGHFHGGDTKLGPWIYKTRAAIGRTLEGLARHGSILQEPFVVYGNLFLRVTHAISRRQELAADALACERFGSRALTEGLRKTEGAAAAFQAYWYGEVAPVVAGGRLPPLGEGFRGSVAAPEVAKQVAERVEEAATKAASNPYDTHPSLARSIHERSSRNRGDACRDGAHVAPSAGGVLEQYVEDARGEYARRRRQIRGCSRTFMNTPG